MLVPESSPIIGDTVDGRNPAPPGIVEIHRKLTNTGIVPLLTGAGFLPQYFW